MSRTQKAVIGTAFQLTQFGLAAVSGVVLFPLVVRYLGAYDNGLWLATGDVVGYLLLGDLGVFSVLPWLIAAEDGAANRDGIARWAASGVAIGVALGTVFVGLGAVAWAVDPARLGMSPAIWETVRAPLALMLWLTGVGFPSRVFMAVLTGLQDVSVVGLLGVVQTGLTVGLTAALITTGHGLIGMAVATAVPPVLIGLAAGMRAIVVFPGLLRVSGRPRWRDCRRLLAEGFGVWVGGFGVRLMTASNGLIFAGLGRPDWGTAYAGTGKAAQVLTPVSTMAPDSGLVGHCQIWGEGDRKRTLRSARCLLLLYLLIPGAAAVGLLAANPGFVRVWLGVDLYAGDYVNALIAANLVAAGFGSGLYRVTAVVGNRRAIGVATVAAGLAYAVLAVVLGWLRGMVGVAEAGLITSTAVVIPIGLVLFGRVYGLRPGEIVRTCLWPWAVRAAPILTVAGWVGSAVASAPAAVVATTLACSAAYLIGMRSLIDQTDWPASVRRWLSRFRLAGPGPVPAAEPVPSMPSDPT